MDGQLDGRTDVWMDRWIDGWLDGWMDGQMDGWMDSCIKILHRIDLQLGSIVTSQCVPIFRVITVSYILMIKIWSHAISRKHYHTLTN